MSIFTITAENPSTPAGVVKPQAVKIGDFTISSFGERDGIERIWIESDSSGDAGEFSVSGLEAAIKAFYEDNF